MEETEASTEQDSVSKLIDSSLTSNARVQSFISQNPVTAPKSQTILVAVRLRPFCKRETGPQIVHTHKEKIVTLLDPYADQYIPEEAFRINRSKEKQYAYDLAFPETASQEQVFDKTTQPLLEGVINGYNATVFAYGATGAGKTYTMLGTQEHPGVMMLTLQALFQLVNSWKDEREFQIRLSYLEIYNEMIRDLINTNTEVMDVREDPVKGIVVGGLSEIHVTSSADVMETIRLSNRNRTTEPTKLNETSSRSHAVLIITVCHRNREENTMQETILQGKLSLIDLAGSERASVTQNKGLRLIEGANINRSLLALANCINALCDIQKGISKVHIPYRDSKLTRILKDSLGGNCSTVMIAWISPLILTFEDTHNTLKYANRAKNIKTHVRANIIAPNAPISKYGNVINKLKNEISDLREQLMTKQIDGTPDIEKYRILINTHFQKEAQAHKHLHELDARMQQLGFIIYARQTEYDTLIQSNGAEHPSVENILDELDTLKNTMKSNENSWQNQINIIEGQVGKREELVQTWKNDKIHEPYLGQLKLEYKKNVLTMEKNDLTRSEGQAGYTIKQKETYIEQLEKQMKLRDELIKHQHDVWETNNIEIEEKKFVKKIQSLEKLSQNAKLILPDIYDRQKPPQQILTERKSEPNMNVEKHSDTLFSPNSIRERTLTPKRRYQSNIPRPKIDHRLLGKNVSGTFSTPQLKVKAKVRPSQSPRKKAQAYKVLVIPDSTQKPHRPDYGQPISPLKSYSKSKYLSPESPNRNSTQEEIPPGSRGSQRSTASSRQAQAVLNNVASKYSNSVYNKPKLSNSPSRRIDLMIKDPIINGKKRIGKPNIKYGHKLRSQRRYD